MSSASVPTLSDGTYAEVVYQSCGHNFWGVVVQYPDFPARFTNAGDGVIFVLTDRCDRGGTVTVAPKGSARIQPVVTASDHRPAVVTIIPKPSVVSIVTLTPPTGPARTVCFDWSR